MAKKDTKTFSDWDDFEDFSMFDEGPGQGNFKSTTKKGKAREAVGELTGGFVSGVKKSLFTRSFYQNLTGAALPKDYSTALDKGLEVKDSLEDLYNTAYRESDKVKDKLTRGVKPIVDKYGDKLPNRMTRPLRSWTRNVRSTGTWTKENKEELESVAALNDIFNTREQTRSVKNTSIQTQVQTGIAQNNMNLTARLVEQQQHLVAYQDQIDATWKRKTLELQYKQFFVQRKSLDVHEQLLGLSKDAFTKIAKNTALPDLVKARGTEVGHRILTEKLYGAAINQFSGLPVNILRTMVGNVTKKMASGSRDLQQNLMSGLGDLHEFLDEGADTAELLGERGSTRMAGEGAGGMASGVIAKYIGKKIKKKYGDNEKVKHGADILSSGLRRVPRMFNGMIQKGDTGSPFMDMMLELMDAREAVRSSTGMVMNRQHDKLDEQIYFDLLTKKSITEIIPGYLTRIHHEIRSLRTGETDQPMLAFDFEKGVFSDQAKLTKRLKDRTIGSRNRSSLKGVHDELSEALGIDKLSDELRNEMMKQFSLASLNNRDFSFRDMFDDSRSNLTVDQKAELEEFLLLKYNITIEEEDQNAGFIQRMKTGISNQYGDTASPDAAKAQRAIDDAISNLQMRLSNPSADFNKSARYGQIEHALKLGIIDEDNGSYVLNKRKFIEALMDGTITDPDDEDDNWVKPKDPNEPTKTQKWASELGKTAKAKYDEVMDNDHVESAKTKMREAKNKAGDLVTTSIDAAGNVMSEVKDKVGNITTTTEDDDGNLITIIRKKGGQLLVQAQDKAGNVINTTTDKSGKLVTSTKSVTSILVDDVKTNGVKETAKDIASKVSDAIPDNEEIKRKRKSAIRAFKDSFTDDSFAKLKSKYGQNDKITEAMDFVTKQYGALGLTKTNIRKAYANYPKLRVMIDDIMQDEENNESIVVGARKAAGDKFANAAKSASDVSNQAKSAATATASSVKDKVKQATTDKASNEDYAEAEAYAEKFIRDNDMADTDGEVKRSLIKDFFKNRFGDSTVYDKFIKSGDYAASAVNRAKKIIGSKGSSGFGGGAAADAISLLFQLGKYAVKAADVMTKPHQAILKQIPRGVAKLIGLFVETVNFSAIEHALWLPGEKEPRMTKVGLMNGRYMNGEGEIIVKPKDITGDIYDTISSPPKLIMTQSEYKPGLFDSTGKLVYKPPSLTGRIVKGIAKLPFKIAKVAAKVTGKLLMGYLKVTTKPVTWMINRILGEKRIEPKLHAELVHLGLTDQTNQRIESLTEMLDERLPGGENKFNDKDGDGKRDGGIDDSKEKHEQRKDKQKKKKSLLSRVFGKKKKGDEDDDEDDDGDGFNIMKMLGKGKFAGRIAGLAKNPYVIGGIAIASLLGWEGMSDKRKNEDPDDIANTALPDSMKDSKAARMGVRISETIVNAILLPNKFARKAMHKVANWNERLNDWSKRKGSQTGDAIKSTLTSLGGNTMGFLFGAKHKRTWNKNFNVDNVLPLYRFRMAQYGFKYNDQMASEAILKFEDDLLKGLIPATDTQAARLSNDVTIEQSAAYFGVSINDEEDLTEWVAWYANRFRPVFLSAVTILQRMGKPGKSLHDVDSLLTKGQKLEFIDKTSFLRTNFNPYDVNVSPLGTETKLSYGDMYSVEKVRAEQIKEVQAMSDDPKDSIEHKERSADRFTKTKNKALKAKKDVKQEELYDHYKAIDNTSFATLIGATKQDRTINQINKQGGRFGGGGAGGTASVLQETRNEDQRAADIDKHGAVGEMFSALGSVFGSMFVSKAHASAFIPEMEHGGALTPMGTTSNKTATAAAIATTASAVYKPNSPDGASSTSIADKPYVAAKYARENARNQSGGNATRYIKNALVKAGYNFTAPASASDYPAKAMPEMGFSIIANNTPWLVGDIIVFSSNKTYTNGHIQIYDGANWISDHIQSHWIPFPDNVPTYTTWRDDVFVKAGNFAPATKKTGNGLDAISGNTGNANVDSNGRVIGNNNGTSGGSPKVDVSGNEKEKTKGTIEKAFDSVKSTVSETYQGVKGFAAGVSNSIGNFFSNTIASMTGSQKEWQMKVYQAFKNAGFSEMQSRILTAEIGRENSYNPKLMFGGHADPHSGKNVGMLSWQKGRVKPLYAFLQQAGVLQGSTIIPGQAALDAQAKFIMHEMKTTHSGVGGRFLSQPNIDYATGAYMIGKEYILWRITDPKFAPAGIKNRDGFYNMLVKQLGDGTAVTSTRAPTVGATSSARQGVSAATLAANTMGIVNTNTGKASTGQSGSPTASASILDTMMSASPFYKPTVHNTPGLAKSPYKLPHEAAQDYISGKQKEDNGGVAGTLPPNSAPAIAAQYCRRNGLSKSKGRCAEYVRKGLQHAGYKFTSQASAYMYASRGIMSEMGMGQIAVNTPLQIGDVIVIANSGPHPHGHICIWDGRNWISDFIQNNWNVYKGNQQYTMWRDRRYLNGAVSSSGPTSSATGDNAGSGGSGGSSTPMTAYAPSKMVYNDYSGLDAKIKDNWKNGTNVDVNVNGKAAVNKVVGTTVENAVSSREDSGVRDGVSAAELAKNTMGPITKAKAKSVANSLVANDPSLSNDEWQPDFSFGSSLMPSTPGNKIEKQTAAIQKQVTKNLTQKMAEVESRKSNEDLSASSQTLRDSLKVQRQMLDKLTNIDDHLAAVARGQKSRNITESSGSNDTSGTTTSQQSKKQNHQVKRPGRDEPMSMAKML